MSTNFYETQIVDYESGEILRSVTKQHVSSEPPYVKLYLKTLCSLKDVPANNNHILYFLLSNISYASQENKFGGQIIVVNKYIKDMICEEYGIAEVTIRKALAAFVEKGLFRRVARGTYQANPEYFGKGDWKDIRNIIATIDFGTGKITPKFKT